MLEQEPSFNSKLEDKSQVEEGTVRFAQKHQRLSNALVPRFAYNIKMPWAIINKICLNPLQQNDSESVKMMPPISCIQSGPGDF